MSDDKMKSSVIKIESENLREEVKTFLLAELLRSGSNVDYQEVSRVFAEFLRLNLLCSLTRSAQNSQEEHI
jgi:hypothetical protein